MKKVFFLLLVVLLAVPAFSQMRAEFTDVTGKVEIRAGSGAWRGATVGMVIDDNTTISTGFNARATLLLGESAIQVEQLTRMVFEEIVESQDTVSTNLFLNVGRVSAEVRNTDDRSQDFRVRSPLSTAAVRGTSFSFDGERLVVSEGVVAFVNRLNQQRSVGAGQASTTTGSEPPRDPADVASEDSTVNTAPVGSGSDDEGDEGAPMDTTPQGPRSTRGSVFVTID